MDCLFWFRTSGFVDDPAAVAARVNETIGGDALATWLSGALRKSGVEAGAPFAEDHGYDFSIARDSRNYLCVCHIGEDGEVERDGAVSVTQMRSLKDRLFGARKPLAHDPLADIVFRLLAAHPEIGGLREG